jgi:hypothetical protein
LTSRPASPRRKGPVNETGTGLSRQAATVGLPNPLQSLERPSIAISLLLGGKDAPDSFPGETRTGEVLQASTLTNLVCTVLSVMITVSWFACRGHAESPFPLQNLAYSGLPLCLA